MSRDPDIRSELKKRLGGVQGEPLIPAETARKATQRRRRGLLFSGLAGMTSILLIVAGVQLLGSSPRDGAVAPAASPSATDSPSPSPKETEVHGGVPGEDDKPPPVTVEFPGGSFDLEAWSYCFGNLCSDGRPGGDLPDVGSPEEVTVQFPLQEWHFDAYFTPTGEKCGRSQRMPVDVNDDGSFTLRPAGHADTYDVTLFGNGDGSLSVSFRWTTPVDGPLPDPKGRAAIISGDPGGELLSYGVELELTNLAETPEEAAAKVTVAAKDGGSVTFDAVRARGRCFPEGTVYWDGPDDKGVEAAELGGGPFEYTVELTLDGERYVGTGTWPRDEIRGNEPSVKLDFTPELPRVR